MVIKARPAGNRPSLTLMSWILPSPINNRVKYGLKKKKKNSERVRVGSRFYAYLARTWLVYIYNIIFLKKTLDINSLFLLSDFIFQTLTFTLTSQPPPFLSLSHSLIEALTHYHRPPTNPNPHLLAALSLFHRCSHTLLLATYSCWSSNKPHYKSKSLLPSSSLIHYWRYTIIFITNLIARLKWQRRSIEPLNDPITLVLQHLKSLESFLKSSISIVLSSLFFFYKKIINFIWNETISYWSLK